MSFFDFSFPEQAQAAHLRSLVQSQRARSRSEARTERAASAAREELEAKVAGLEGDLAFLSRVVSALLERLDAQGDVSREDLRRALDAEA